MTALRSCLLLTLIWIFGPGCASMGTEAHMVKPKGKGPVSETISANRSKFDQCIGQSIGLNAGENLRLIVRFRLAEDGRVKQAELESMSSPDPDFADCVMKRLRRIQFPPPESEKASRIRYPLDFAQARE